MNSEKQNGDDINTEQGSREVSLFKNKDVIVLRKMIVTYQYE